MTDSNLVAIDIKINIYLEGIQIFNNLEKKERNITKSKSLFPFFHNLMRWMILTKFAKPQLQNA